MSGLMIIPSNVLRLGGGRGGLRVSGPVLPPPTHYVSKTGNDTTGDGSASAPWLTIQKAINTVSIAGGHIISVGAGTYAEDSGAINALRCDRTFLSKVTIRPASGATVVITGVGDYGASVAIGSGCTNFEINGTGGTLSIELAGSDSINILSGGTSGVSGVAFRNLTIVNNVNAATAINFINGTQTNLTFENVSCTMGGTGNTVVAGVYGAAAGWITNISFIDCNFVGGQYAIRVIAGGRVDGLNITRGNYSTLLNTGCAIGNELAFTGLVQNITLTDVVVRGIGNGVTFVGSTGTHCSYVTFDNCDIDVMADLCTGVTIGNYVDHIFVDGGSYKGAGDNGAVAGRGGFFVEEGTAPTCTDLEITGSAHFEARTNGPLCCGIGCVDGVWIHGGCTFGSGLAGTDERGITLQNGSINVVIEDVSTASDAMGFRVGHDGTNVYTNSAIIVRRCTMNTLGNAPALIVGSGVTDCTIENCTMNGGGPSAIRLRGAETNANIVIQNNAIGYTVGAAGTPDAAITLYGAREVSILNNTIDSAYPATLKTYTNGALVVQDNTITGNEIAQSGGGVYNWDSAEDGGGNVVDSEVYTLTGGANFGTLLGTAGIANIAALRVVWDAYGAGTNEDNSSMAA